MKSTRRFTTTLLALLGLATLQGCGSDFDPGSRVNKLRVLAVQADQPYARPGEEVKLEALAHDPVAGRRTTWAWAACVNPDSSTVAGCLAALARDAAKTGRPPTVVMGDDLRTFSLQVPADALESLPGAARSHAMVGVITVACPGTLSLRASSTELPFVCSDASGRALGTDEFVVGIKRIMVRASDRNDNPRIERVLWDGADWPETDVKEVEGCDTGGNKWDDCSGADRHTIAAVSASGTHQAGRDEFGLSFDEQVVAQYYATEGIFEHDTRLASDPSSGWVARKAASGQTLTLWLVLRDDRGGVSWATRRVRVR